MKDLHVDRPPVSPRAQDQAHIESPVNTSRLDQPGVFSAPQYTLHYLNPCEILDGTRPVRRKRDPLPQEAITRIDKCDSQNTADRVSKLKN